MVKGVVGTSVAVKRGGGMEYQHGGKFLEVGCGRTDPL